jgi:hypothetical protein
LRLKNGTSNCFTGAQNASADNEWQSGEIRSAEKSSNKINQSFKDGGRGLHQE